MLTREKPAAAAATVKRSPSARRKRPQLGIIVTKETKDRIEELASKSGRSMGQQVEHMIERCLAYDAAYVDMRGVVRTIQEVKAHVTTATLERLLFDHMWTPVHTDQGARTWAPPGTELPITITRKP